MRVEAYRKVHNLVCRACHLDNVDAAGMEANNEIIRRPVGFNMLHLCCIAVPSVIPWRTGIVNPQAGTSPNFISPGSVMKSKILLVLCRMFMHIGTHMPLYMYVYAHIIAQVSTHVYAHVSAHVPSICVCICPHLWSCIHLYICRYTFLFACPCPCPYT